VLIRPSFAAFPPRGRVLFVTSSSLAQQLSVFLPEGALCICFSAMLFNWLHGDAPLITFQKMTQMAVYLRQRILACIAFCGLVFALSFQWAQAQAPAPGPSQASFQLPSLFADQRRLDLPAPLGLLIAPADKPPTPEQLLEEPLAEQFKPWQTGMALPTSSQQDVWLRLQLPQQSRPQSWMLRIPRLTLEKATLHQRSADNPAQWQQQSAGLDVPNINWPIRARDPIFEISTRNDQTQLFFIRLQNALPITENIQLIHSSDFGNGANYAGSLNGVIIGIFTILSLISLISWRINRNSHFGWFALFSLSIMLAQLTVSGYMFMRIWPGSVYLAKTMGWVLPLFSLACLSRFALSVSYAQDLSKPIYRGLWSVIALCGLLSICVLAMPMEFPRALLNAAYAAGMLVILGSLSWIAWRSQHWLWLIVASLVPVILSVLARLAYNQGWVAHMEIALLAGVVTATLGLICIYSSLVVNQRERLATSQHEDALETKDAATGLFNARIAQARLPQVILRSKRFEKACGVILVRWIDFDKTMASVSAIDRGRIFSHLGNRLNRLARDIDTVARFGDDQFLFLVEAPVTHEQLSALASKILTTCMRPSSVMPDQKGFDLHEAIWLSSDMPAAAPQVMELLKTRINQMREGTQRRVQFINTALSTAPALDQSDPEHAQRLVDKINELEKTQGLPTIDLTSRKVKQNSLDTGSSPAQQAAE
jgi:two-component system, sensor histidine kinase LadS